MAIKMMEFGDMRCLRLGSTNAAPANEPMPTLVKKRPSWAAEHCSSWNAITGKSDGTTEITNEKRKFRKRIIFMREEL
jgi:hypothetical protein